ncbi:MULTISPECIES: restriction endonuclease subunit S [Enterococcus]|nr:MULTISPECIES: restriction endonuclease subunit S [Enterococcus]MBO6418771.1 restriction endonuclease subunit S [Enterococcus gallinarum]MBO6420684.1 restriction endonuclease subunit S [Enterococcus gallinarum]QCT90777.1 restriction endonuclease subunit S [Enterococcus sp. M190262]
MMNKNKPEIRFTGFTEEWEQRKLGNVTEKIGSGKTPKGGNATYQTEGVPLIRSQNIFNNRFNQNDVAYISKKTDDEMKNSRVYTGDILLNITGASIGRSAVYRQKMAANVNQHVCIIRPKKEYYSDFIQLNISSSKGQREIDLNQAGGGREGLNFQQISKMSFFYPSVEEQQKIGTFFKQLDDTIALHQRELELLKETKKGFLQKMFPKEGEKVPEIRFPGFTEEWEQRKVFEISKVTYGGGTPKTNTKEFWNGNIPWIQSSDLEINRLFNVSPKKKITNEAVKKSAAKIIPPNSIAIVTRVGVGKLALMPFEYATSQDFLSLSELQIDSYFGIFSLYSMLQKELKNIQGTSIKGMTKSDLLEKKVTIPKKYEEQQKIGNFFKQLDDTIALHQRELDLLKETKKGFLQKLFV